MNKYHKGMRVLCKFPPSFTRQKLICTVQKQVGDVVVIDLPCAIKGRKTLTIDFNCIIEILPPPEPKEQKKPPPAPPNSPYGRLKQRLIEMATDQPYKRPPEEPPPAPIIQSKPESKPIQSSCIFDLINIDDLNPDEIKLMKQLLKENK